MSSEQPTPDPQLEHALETYARTVDAVHMTAVAIGRCLQMAPEDIPRICASAAVRTVEKLIESYDRRRALVDAGHTEWTLQEQAERRREIHAAAEDCELVLTEALRQITQIRVEAAIGSTVSVQ